MPGHVDTNRVFGSHRKQRVDESIRVHQDEPAARPVSIERKPVGAADQDHGAFRLHNREQKRVPVGPGPIPELGLLDGIADLCGNIAAEIDARKHRRTQDRLRLGHNKTIGAIAHRLCQLIWINLYQGVRYEERDPAVSEKSTRARTSRMIGTLQMLGNRIEPVGTPA